MKLVFLSHSGSTTGGAEQCLIEYVEVLKNAGHDCVVIIPHDDGLRGALDGRGIMVEVIGYGWATMPHKQFNPVEVLRSNGNALTKIFQFVEKYKPDAIVTNTAVIPWGLYVGKSLGIPTGLFVHEILNDKDPSLRILPNHDGYMKILNENTDFVIYNSNFVKNQYVKWLTGPRISKQILYPLPPLDEKKIESYYVLNEIGEKLEIAIIGAVSERKNQIEALEAAKILKEKGITNYKINIFGDNVTNYKYVKRLKDFITREGLSDLVEIKGYTNSVYEEINKHNVILSTATYEPFGRTIVEGQLFGRITISNDTGGGPELIDDKKSGLIYALGNPTQLAGKIEWIIKRKSDALKVGADSKKIQQERFLKVSRYDALFELADFVSKYKKAPHDQNIHDPVLSLVAYNDYLSDKYRSIDRLLNNKITRKAKKVVRSTEAKAKKIVKKIITKL